MLEARVGVACLSVRRRKCPGTDIAERPAIKAGSLTCWAMRLNDFFSCPAILTGSNTTIFLKIQKPVAGMCGHITSVICKNLNTKQVYYALFS